jgi:hypothetical protein
MKFVVLFLTVILHQSRSVFEWPQDVVASVENLNGRAALSNYRLDPEWVANLTTNVSRALRYFKGKANADILETFLEILFSMRNNILKYALSENWLIAIDLEQLDVLSLQYTDLFEQLIQIGAHRWAAEERQLLSLAVEFHIFPAVQALLDHIYSNLSLHFLELVVSIQQSIINLDFRCLAILLKHIVTSSNSGSQILDYLLDTSMGRSALDIVALQCSLHSVYCNKLKETLSQYVTINSKDLELVNYANDKTCQNNSCPSTGETTSHWFQSWSVMTKNNQTADQTTWIRKLCAAEQIETYDTHWRQSLLPEEESVRCDIPTVSLTDLDQHRFIKDYINMSQPVLIKNVIDKWLLRTSFKRDKLISLYGDSDVLVGYIPYGEVFGEFNGYATITEFITYMDKLVTEKVQAFNLTEPPPMYVFDSEILREKFHGQYQLPDLFSLWSNVVQVHQFILGPKGSGAPFHYHCPAVNVACYGRKR